LHFARANGNAPLKPRKEPSSASSPANSNSCKLCRGICPYAANTPIAIGKSNRPPSFFGKSAGAKLIVMRRVGKTNCEFIKALRTRSLLSLTAVSGRPTIDNAGKPGDR